MDNTVTVVNRVFVNCTDADRTPISDPFYLGPLDQLTLPFIPIVVVFVYKYPSTSASSSIGSFMSFDRFREAVAHVLDYYPHLTGRIRINPDDKTTEIHQLHTGVEVIQAESHVSIEELEKSKKKALLESTLSSSDNCTSGSPSAHHRRLTRLTVNDLPNQGNALLPPFDPTIAGICRNPILTVQHTRFTCGSVAIGVRTSHNICDADGMFLFARHLAEMYRQLSANTSPDSTVRLTLSHPPLIHSYLAELRLMSPEEKEVAQQFKPTILEVDETLNWAPFDPPPTTNTIPTDSSLASSTSDESVASSSSSSSSPPPPPPPPVVVTGRILHFSKRALAAIKEEANSPTPSSTTAASASLSSPPTSLSTFVALSAHLWRCVYRARVDHALSNGTAIDTFLNQTDAFLTSVNYRTPNRFDLSSQYFPNCVFAPYFSLSHSSLYSGELSDIGKGIHECVRSLSPTDGVRTLRWLSSQSNKRHVRLGFRYEKGGFLVSSWNGFDMIQGCRMDNTPMLVSTPFTPISLVDGLVYYLPAPTSTGDQVSHSDADAGAVAVDDNADDDSGGMDVNIALSASVWRQLDSDPNFTRYCSY